MLALFFSSCEKTNETGQPSIQLLKQDGFISKDTSLAVGTTMKFAIQAKGDEIDLTNFLIRTYADSLQIAYDTGLHAPALAWQGEFTKDFTPVQEWVFVIRDRYGNEDQTSITIKTDSSSNFTPLQTFSNIQLGAQDNGLGSFFGFYPGTVFTHSQASADAEIQKIIDLVYYYFGEDENVIASPGANIESGVFPGDLSDWEYRNTARFLLADISIADFGNAQNDSIIIANYLPSAKRKAKNLSADDIYTFQTQDGRLGIFKVKEIVGTSEGSVSVDIKVQEVKK
jgi:hypothetical protein